MSSWFWHWLSKSADLSKPWGRFFQILYVSQKVWTLKKLNLLYGKGFSKLKNDKKKLWKNLKNVKKEILKKSEQIRKKIEK